MIYNKKPENEQPPRRRVGARPGHFLLGVATAAGSYALLEALLG